MSIICVWLMVVSALPAQQWSGANASVTEPGGRLSTLTYPYRAKEVAPISLANSYRLESLLRGGLLYLSLQDAIALALENNLDIDIQRYGLRLAEVDLDRAKAGGAIRGVSTSISQTSTGAAGGSAATGGSTGAVSAAGIPSLDPVMAMNYSWGHTTAPQVNSFIVGSNSIVSTINNGGFQIQKGFLTGATTTLGMTNRNTLSSSGRSDFNPSTTGALSLNISQPLLQGFGRALNSRLIRIAKNNLGVSDLVFRLQVITTVSSVVSQYWNLVSYNEDVKVRRQALTLAEKLYSDNKKQVEIGTLAPIAIVQAEAEVAARQQDVVVSETQVLQQETILKNALSRTGVASPALAEARIVPTDRIRVPELERIEPIQDLIARALDNRPELGRIRIQLDNSKINLKATRNALLPQLSAFATLNNNALSGEINSLPIPSTIPGVPPQLRSSAAVDPFFLGGYGNFLRQMFARNFPDYTFGFQLSVPLRNRSAQADMVSAQLNLRQSELQQQQQINQVRVDVQNSMIGVQQARARFQTATKNRLLQEQNLDAEQKKYALGASTIFFVIQAQRDLATAQAGEVAALSAYALARVELNRATGQTLENNNIMIDEAVKGQVSRPPTPLPVIDPR
ncbi:MAG: TolC family protein [Bryobacterales bacterium]|nr:TolC family protein [Bryobacterales bacterium]